MKKTKVKRVSVQALRKEYGKEILPFIKPTRRVHESGFRIFNVGYCSKDGLKECVLGSYTDHVWWSEPMNVSIGLEGPKRMPSLNIDLDLHGRIRFYNGFQWAFDRPLSTAELVYVG